ncbi:unnamed protein product [Clonostachys rosea]|uniref:Uncharacterized protein n=1 Tax=Bionectria ochroleuca TaxID=29856 RepID=A0ABY6UAJ3_BIOOC|nr:unnamed protein product [Clonostachys rosea]
MEGMCFALKAAIWNRVLVLQEVLDAVGRDVLTYPGRDFFSAKAETYPAGLFSHEKLFEISLATLKRFKGDNPNGSHTNAEEVDRIWTWHSDRDPIEVEDRLFMFFSSLETYEQFLLWQLDIRHISTIDRNSDLGHQFRQYLGNHKAKSEHFFELAHFLDVSFGNIWKRNRALTNAIMDSAGECKDFTGHSAAVAEWATSQGFVQPPRLSPSPDEQDPWSTYIEFVHFLSVYHKMSGHNVDAGMADISQEWAILAREMQPECTAISLLHRLEMQDNVSEAENNLCENYLALFRRLRDDVTVADYHSASLLWALGLGLKYEGQC